MYQAASERLYPPWLGDAAYMLWPHKLIVGRIQQSGWCGRGPGGPGCTISQRLSLQPPPREATTITAE
jgi:hypothetical protein